jgi:hypothetical protein
MGISVRFRSPLQLQRTNVELHHVLCVLRLDAPVDSERFFAKEVGHSGMR